MTLHPCIRSLHRSAAHAATLLVSIACALAPATARSAAYTLTVLGTLRADGTGESLGRGINNSGLVVGRSSTSSDGEHAFRWTLAGGMIDAGTVVSPFPAAALAVNNSGQLCGFGLAQSNGFAKAFQQPPAGSLAVLPAPAGSGDSYALSISDGGAIVGWANLSSGCGSPLCAGNPGHAARWDGTVLTFLPEIGGYFSLADGISPDGTKICGFAADAAGHIRGFRIRGALVDVLPPLPGYTEAYPEAVNDAGVVVGYSYDGVHSRATRWVGATPDDLGAIAGAVSSLAAGINTSGTIVGYSILADGSNRATRFPAGGSPEDLNALIAPSPGDTLLYADDVNDAGQIVGDVKHGSFVRAMVLTPSATADAGSPAAAARALELSAPQPNPSRTTTRVRFATPHAGRAHVAVVDVAGREVATLLDGDLAAGGHALEWNARDAAGRPVAPGVYFVRVRAGAESRSRTLVIAR